MILGYKLTEQQADSLIGEQYAPDCFFYPMPDANDVKFIFSGEVDGCINPIFLWVKDLPQAEYIPKQNTILQYSEQSTNNGKQP